ADPEPVRAWVPALRSSVRSAAPRPGHVVLNVCGQPLRRRGSANGLCNRRIDKQTEANRNPVPAVDDIDHQGELDLLFLGELSFQALIGAFLAVAFGKPRQRLGPVQRGAFAIGVAWGFSPG